MKELRKHPGRFFFYLVLAALGMSVGWGALLWYIATPVIGVLMGVVIFVVVFACFWTAETTVVDDLGRIYDRRFDD